VRFVERQRTGTDQRRLWICGAPLSLNQSGHDNAEDGDTIYVGPGRYGDLSANGSFRGPGDEQPQARTGVAGCIVCIEKPLHYIYSTGGVRHLHRQRALRRIQLDRVD